MLHWQCPRAPEQWTSPLKCTLLLLCWCKRICNCPKKVDVFWKAISEKRTFRKCYTFKGPLWEMLSALHISFNNLYPDEAKTKRLLWLTPNKPSSSSSSTLHPVRLPCVITAAAQQCRGWRCDTNDENQGKALVSTKYALMYDMDHGLSQTTYKNKSIERKIILSLVFKK